jgi:hypothetical protein
MTADAAPDAPADSLAAPDVAAADLAGPDLASFELAVPDVPVSSDLAAADLAAPDLASFELAVPDVPVSSDVAAADLAAPDLASFELAVPDVPVSSDLAAADLAAPDLAITDLPAPLDIAVTVDGSGVVPPVDANLATPFDTGIAGIVDAGDDTGDPAAGHRVLSMALAAGISGTTMAYEIVCTGCSIAWPRTRVMVLEPGVEKTEAANPLHDGRSMEGKNPLYDPTEPRRGAVVAGAVTPNGTQHGYLLDSGDTPLSVVAAPFVPGGAIISAKAASLGIGRQTPSTSFGTMVRSGQLVATAAGGFLAAGLDSTQTPAPITLASVSSDLVVSEPGVGASVAPDADLAVLATSAQGNAIAYRTRGASDGDGPVRVQVRAGTEALLAPVEGAPAALWTDGAGFRVGIKKADSIAAIWDGKTTFQTPRSDEAACSSLIFDESGRALFLHAGPKSTVLYVQNGAGFDSPILLSRRDVAGPETDACALAAVGGEIHVAWTEDHSFIQYAALDGKTLATLLRTRHDTAKNSVGNIR